MEKKKRKEEKKPVTGYTETMAFNNRSYKRFWQTDGGGGSEAGDGDRDG